MEFTADDTSTPSINAALMPRFVGRRVRLVCELEDPGDGKTLAARASDKGAVSVVKDARAGLPTTKYAEFVGVVEAPGKLREESNTNWGDSFGERHGKHERRGPHGLLAAG